MWCQGAAYSGTTDCDNLSLSECKLCVLVHIGGLGGGIIVVQGHHLLQCGERRKEGWREGKGCKGKRGGGVVGGCRGRREERAERVGREEICTPFMVPLVVS